MLLGCSARLVCLRIPLPLEQSGRRVGQRKEEDARDAEKREEGTIIATREEGERERKGEGDETREANKTAFVRTKLN